MAKQPGGQKWPARWPPHGRCPQRPRAGRWRASVPCGRVLSKNTNELEICVPCRFGLEVAGCYVSTIWKPHEYFDLTRINLNFSRSGTPWMERKWLCTHYKSPRFAALRWSCANCALESGSTRFRITWAVRRLSEMRPLRPTCSSSQRRQRNTPRRHRPVQKHKRTQDWRTGPFRSSSPRGEPQIWGVSEAMSAIRVPRLVPKLGSFEIDHKSAA